MKINSSLRKFLVNPVSHFLKLEASSGVLLAGCALIAMVLANSSLVNTYNNILNFKFFNMSILHWINDGFMAVFFFVIGMEIKKELLVGELSSFKKAALPAAAALGGMIVPAMIYSYFNPEQPNLNGWGIPMATDIAFALGILTLFGPRIPLSLKVFLLALAIVDDLGAVLVIAAFYTNEIKLNGLVCAGAIFSIIFLLRFFHIRNYGTYLILGALAWFGVYYSGIHATIAGVLLGLITPYKYPVEKGSLTTYSPIENLIHHLHPWVSFFIMPLFALANAGINLTGIDFQNVLSHPVHQGVLWGLLLGKPLGIFIFAVAAAKFGIARLPSDLKWRHILGTSFLGGIGFTMALFISSLSLSPDLEIYSKTGIILGSLIGALVGSFILYFTLKPNINYLEG